MARVTSDCDAMRTTPCAVKRPGDHLRDAMGLVRQQQEKKELWFLSLLDGLRQDEDYQVPAQPPAQPTPPNALPPNALPPNALPLRPLRQWAAWRLTETAH